MDRKPRRYTTRSLTRYVVFSISALLIFTITDVVLTCFSIELSDTLVQCFFAFFGGETVTCGIIKLFKLKEVRDNE